MSISQDEIQALLDTLGNTIGTTITNALNANQEHMNKTMKAAINTSHQQSHPNLALPAQYLRLCTRLDTSKIAVHTSRDAHTILPYSMSQWNSCMLPEGTFHTHLYTEAETNKEVPLSTGTIAENAAKIRLWCKHVLNSNLKDDDDPAIDEAYADFDLLKKKYMDMADDYCILMEVFKVPTISMLLESKRREQLKVMEAMLLLHVHFDPNDIAACVDVMWDLLLEQQLNPTATVSHANKLHSLFQRVEALYTDIDTHKVDYEKLAKEFLVLVV